MPSITWWNLSAGDGMELAGVEAINADVNRRQAGIAPAFDIARQAVTVGSDRNLTDRRVSHGGNNLGEVAAQEGSPPVRRTFSVPSAEKRA